MILGVHIHFCHLFRYFLSKKVNIHFYENFVSEKYLHVSINDPILSVKHDAKFLPI